MRSAVLWLLGALVGLAGCGQDESLAPAGPVIAAPIEAVPLEPGEAIMPEDLSADDNKPAEDRDQVLHVTEFVPPFPERIDLFLPPQRNKFAARVSHEQGDSAIELKGFVTPPGDKNTRAILAIDGIIQPVAEGEEKFGIKVVSIQQPEVTLQRGSSRWIESLE